MAESIPTEIFEAQREPRRDLGDQIVDSHVARILDLSKIPKMLVPDEHITEAIKVLMQAGFLQCPHRSEYERLGKLGLLDNFDDPEPDPLGELNPCPYSVDFHKPDYHFHLSFDSANRNPRGTPTHPIHLYRMPRLFPTFPIPPIGALPRNDPYYRLTSDDRIRLFSHCDSKWPLGSQSDHEAFHPVKIPHLARWVEVHQLRILRNLPAAKTDDECGYHGAVGALAQEVSPEYDNQKPYPNRRSRRKQMDSDYQKYLYELCINMKRRGELPPPEGERIHPAGLKKFVSWLEMLDIEYNSADLE
ncbi:uncharacterized protein BO66DRAFT_442331 [Aspergillus aculeatinus CBS 121060]|uniref:Uncharacterized protein n=1 Tax=Aspergillus aculeatinus CBS 121060 TaxID=1448322 RepID=A0ACD1GXS1_9EURO|nr:hypothetical protein BO66DRAFT_442331 [Aspergillus aculeatinus CBS 121060]RAH66112.1 hypothetical protein BO66DRAFT_442331 [Aspergillus aculeatinus CBS 121060]